jgi:hypothetical protein
MDKQPTPGTLRDPLGGGETMRPLHRYPPLFVHNSVLKTEKLSENALLPRGMEPLLGQVRQTTLVRENNEFRVLKIRSSVVHCQQNCKVFLLVS